MDHVDKFFGFPSVRLPQGCDELLLTNDFLRNSREAFSSFTGVIGSKRAAFPVKFLNILDPLRDDNNLGRSVSKGIASLITQ